MTQSLHEQPPRQGWTSGCGRLGLRAGGAWAALGSDSVRSDSAYGTARPTRNGSPLPAMELT
ncbi:hypothetical protein ACIQI8_04045 [Streptomyces sp. NPDC092369]|uniref:hypothetical protein n=1 Tax=Streptomyces sp. NPDC092369 TaxID=3366015 RepID=UPI00380E4E53